MRGYNSPASLRVQQTRNFSQDARVNKDAHVLLFMIRPLWRMPAAKLFIQSAAGFFLRELGKPVGAGFAPALWSVPALIVPSSLSLLKERVGVRFPRGYKESHQIAPPPPILGGQK